MYSNASKQVLFKRCLAAYLGIESDRIFLFFKGRVALYAILKAIDIRPGDEVILPAFTCVAAVNPIIYCGAVPIYVDIDPRTYTIDSRKIEKRISPRTKAILTQNTFGLSADLNPILALARQHNLLVIEDCAHGFGGTYHGQPNGTIADCSFFSAQWNKPFSTGLGGIAIVKNESMRERVARFEQECQAPSFYDMVVLRLLLAMHAHFVTPRSYWQFLKVYRWLSGHNLILGSSQKEELCAPRKPQGFEKKFSALQAHVGLLKIVGHIPSSEWNISNIRHPWYIDRVNEQRRRLAHTYSTVLKELGMTTPYEPEYATHTYLKFPLLVRERQRFFDEAMRAHIEVGDWFMSPIHPIVEGFDSWQYRWGENPIAEKISRCIINLPTHTKMTETDAQRTIHFLRSHSGDIYHSYAEVTG